MKSVISFIGIGLLVLFLLPFAACPTVDPLKDLPQTEYEQAQKYRERIAKWNFAQYAQDEFNAGEAAFKAGEEKYKKENLVSKKSFDEANNNYRIVIRKGIQARMKQSDDDISVSRQKADSIKASVAAKAEYEAARADHERAKALVEQENWEEAEPILAEAKKKYEAAHDAARVKKNKADDQHEKMKREEDAIKALQEELDSKKKPEESEESEPAPEAAPGT